MSVQYKDYYDILGVARSASQSEIQKAYRKLAKKYHPDVSKAKDADARYREINEAYEVLKDPDKRARYDTLGANWQQGQDFSPPPGWGNGGRVEYGGDFASFSDFFKTIFGGMGFSGSGTGGGFRDVFSSPVRKRDSEVELKLSLEETAKGGTRTLSLRLPGQAERTVNVNLPRGVADGSRIRLPGKAAGGGDLYITMRVAPHPVFEVSGYDLTRAVKLAPWQAVLGGTVAVDTLDGSVDVKLPPGIQAGQKLRLRGKGLPKRGEGESGDMFVRVEISIPKILTERQKDLWQELARQEANI